MAEHQPVQGKISPASAPQTPACQMPQSPETWHGSLARALRDRDVRVLWLATVAYHLALGMQQVLLGWVILTLTNSESMVGLVFAVRSTPNLLVGFAAGALTDRLDRRCLMRVAALSMAAVAILLAVLQASQHLTVWLLLFCTAMLGLGQAFEMTARQAYVVDALGVQRAVQGIAIISLAQRFGGVLGSLLAGATIEWWGPATAFLVMGLSYSTGAGVLFALRSQGIAAPTVREPMRQNISNYIHALRTNQDMRSLMISTAAAELFGFSHQVMLPILAREVLHVGPGALGVLTSFRFLGGVCGVAILTALGEIRRRGRLLMVTVILFGLGLVGLAYAPSFWLAVLCVVFINIMAAATDVLHLTLLQLSVANEQRGRAMGSWIVGTGTAPLGHLEVGYVAALAGAQLTLLTNGCALILVTVLVMLAMPRLRRL